MERAQAGGERWGKWLALSCAAFAASLLSKALGIMLPFLLLALDVYPLKRWRPELRKRVLLEKLPYLALAVADGLVMLRAMSHIGQLRAAGTYAIGDRVLQAGYGLWFYVWKTALPTGLHAYYALGDSVSLWRAEFVGPLIGTAAITGILIALRRRWPAGLAAWVCYAILLTPVLGFFVKGYQRSADRYSYLSCLPISFLTALGVAALSSARQSGRLSGSAFRAAAGGLALAAGVLGLLTFLQVGVWKNSLTLFDRVLAYEQRAALPYVNRGSSRQENGDIAGALADYTEALRVNPRSVEALNDRGQLRQELGEVDGAIADFSAAIAVAPYTFEAYNNRASVRILKKDWDGALADIDQALALRNWEPEPYAIRARVKQAKGYIDAAIDDCNAALRVAPPEWPFRKNVESLRDALQKQKRGR
jgi:tetratricopeptide (TPR) repeat protein